MRTLQSLDKALELLIQGNHDSVFSAKVALESDRINYGNWFAENGNLKPCYDHRNMKNRQDVSYKKIIHENGSIYALKKEVLFNSNGFGGKNPGYIAMSNEEAIDIDNEYHFRIAELYYDEFFKDNFVV
jgi:CMP-N-acetylneuraminic acid synthetase